MKPLIGLLFALGASVISKPAIYQIRAETPPTTQLSGNKWHYNVPFPVSNAQTIEKLISCESSGENVARLDSNHKMSYGILQFQSSTWADFSKLSGIDGGPMNPAAAIEMADWAINHGFLSRWTCARIEHLL
jgi:hypothetical protein